MGFVNPRAFCPNCGAKIHTKGGRTGKECPECRVPLTGAVNGFTNKAKRDEKAVARRERDKRVLERRERDAPSQEHPQAATAKLDALERLARLKESGLLTDEEVEAQKRVLLDDA